MLFGSLTRHNRSCHHLCTNALAIADTKMKIVDTSIALRRPISTSLRGSASQHPLYHCISRASWIFQEELLHKSKQKRRCTDSAVLQIIIRAPYTAVVVQLKRAHWSIGVADEVVKVTDVRAVSRRLIPALDHCGCEQHIAGRTERRSCIPEPKLRLIVQCNDLIVCKFEPIPGTLFLCCRNLWSWLVLQHSDIVLLKCGSLI